VWAIKTVVSLFSATLYLSTEGVYRMTVDISSDLDLLYEIFNDTKQRAVYLRQLSFLSTRVASNGQDTALVRYILHTMQRR